MASRRIQKNELAKMPYLAKNIGRLLAGNRVCCYVEVLKKTDLKIIIPSHVI